ncbi:MAG: CopD family protein [Thermaerobacter sp.]|nr:CopD family protein [Thermaerobacter sp.]
MRQFVLFVHLFAAVFWLGEMLMVGLVLGPVSRKMAAGERAALFRAIGRSSLPLAWGAIGVLLVTGVLNLVLMGVPLGNLFSGAFYATPFGIWLGVKLLAVLAMLLVSAYHDFVVGRRANAVRQEITRLKDAAPESTRQAAEHYRKLAMRLGMLNMVLAIVVLFAAAGLVAAG